MSPLDLLHAALPRLPRLDIQRAPRCGLDVCLACEAEDLLAREAMRKLPSLIADLAKAFAALAPAFQKVAATLRPLAAGCDRLLDDLACGRCGRTMRQHEGLLCGGAQWEPVWPTGEP